MDPLVLQSVTMRFDDVVALDGVSLAAAPSRIIGLVGHNGAGKSTVINLLAGLLRPSSGVVSLLGGDPADRTSAHERIRRAGFLLEDDALFEFLTGREFLEFIGYAFGVSAPEGARRASALGRFFAMEADLDRLAD